MRAKAVIRETTTDDRFWRITSGRALPSQCPLCWKRLEKEGYIEGRAVILDQKALGLIVTVITQVKLDRNVTETLDAFEKAVHDHLEILSSYSMSGESDYTLRIVARSIEDYELFLKEKLAKLPHVASLNSSFALKSVKNTTALPL